MTVAENASRITSIAHELGVQLADYGYNHKQTGRDPLSLAVFENATSFIIGEENNIAQLLYENYMIGYNGERQ